MIQTLEKPAVWFKIQQSDSDIKYKVWNSTKV